MRKQQTHSKLRAFLTRASVASLGLSDRIGCLSNYAAQIRRALRIAQNARAKIPLDASTSRRATRTHASRDVRRPHIARRLLIFMGTTHYDAITSARCERDVDATIRVRHHAERGKASALLVYRKKTLCERRAIEFFFASHTQIFRTQCESTLAIDAMRRESANRSVSIRSAHTPNLLFNRSLTACGLALPPVCFIT